MDQARTWGSVVAALLLSGCGAVPGEIADEVREEPLGDVRSVHRLNRVEYDNTIRDLTGTAMKPGALFPPDDISHGFDNIADVLSLSPVHLEMAYNAADAVIDDVMAREKIRHQRFEAEDIGATNGVIAGDAWKLVTEGEIVVRPDPPVGHSGAGTYTIAALAHAERTGPTPVRLVIRVDGDDVEAFDVLDSGTKTAYRTTVMLDEAPASVALAYTNDLGTGSIYRNVHVDAITVDGPTEHTVANALRERIVGCDLLGDADCLHSAITRFGDRAWRRPLTHAEINSLVSLAAKVEAVELDYVDQPAARDEGLAAAFRAILASPNFLFRIERGSAESTRLDAFALASRLSYFLWGTQPDEQLYRLAAAGELTTDAVLAGEIERMLSDPRAAALVDNFVGQWLSLRGLDEHEPDARVFPDYDVALKNDMVTETKLVFGELLAENRPIQELLTADFTYTNERLANHYDLEIDGGAFTRQPLPPERAGILGHASILTATSHPGRTSPVKRGKWVLEQLLCTIPPPPPPGVDGLAQEATPSGSLRERMEAHRAEPVCAGCHTFMDPIGFGLENFDGTGRFRQDDGGFAIDASGTLPSGDAFEGGVELARLIAGDERFPRCVVTKLATFALGHAPKWNARPFTDRWLAGGAGLRDLVKSLIMSEPFRTHRVRHALD